jgi:hypothetical protein
MSQWYPKNAEFDFEGWHVMHMLQRISYVWEI